MSVTKVTQNREEAGSALFYPSNFSIRLITSSKRMNINDLSKPVHYAPYLGSHRISG
jgi:hypothetical protein